MSNDTKYIPPAFPVPPPNQSPYGDWIYASEGISIRDYFAAAALSGLLARANNKGTNADNATVAYSIADEMLRAREL